MSNYTKTVYANGTTPALSAANLNKMETAIESAHTEIAAVTTGVSGIVMAFPSVATPAGGWLKCNGQSVSTTTYAGLFAVVGYTFGGAGSAFNVPDLRGCFIRGWDNRSTGGYDNNRAFGSYQADDNKPHKHQVQDEPGSTGVSAPGNRSTSGQLGNEIKSYSEDTRTTDTYRSPANTPEARPKNIAFIYYIKT